jgi:hypothetical protein
MIQRIQEENTDRMLLASFVGGLAGEIGKLSRIHTPQNLDQALNAALAVREAIRQVRRPETFYTRSEKRTKASSSRSKNEYRGERENKPIEFRENTYAHSPEGTGYYKRKRDTRYSKEMKCF